MKTWAMILVLLPPVCLGSNSLTVSSGFAPSMEVIQSTQANTLIRFTSGELVAEPVVVDNAEYARVSFTDTDNLQFGSINEEGAPDLPLYSNSVIIPDMSGVRVNIISANYESFYDIDVLPCQPLQIEGRTDAYPFTRNTEVYSQDQFYPGDIVTIGEPSIFKDFRIINTVIYPVQYNPVTREMRVYTDIEYELVYEGIDTRNVKTRNNNYISEAFLPLYRQYLANADIVLTDYTPRRGGYLIIYGYSCETQALELAEWKHRKGFVVQTISTNDLGGNPSTTLIKSTIQDIYNASDPPLEYVALIGDMDGSLGYKVASDIYSGDVTDHPYSLLEGADIEPDVIVGRLSVRDANSLNTVMAKTLGYEKTPYMEAPDYYHRGLAVGGPYGSTSPRLMALWVRQTMLDNGYTQADTVIDNTGGSYYTNRITSLISDGVSLVTYRGWGGSSGWSYPSWHTTDIGQLSNGWKMGIMATCVCGTGDFEATECFGECWIRAGSQTTPKGGPGAFGPSNYWTHTRWNNTIVMGVTSGLLEQGAYHLGAMLIAGKLHAHESFPHVTGYHGWTWYYHIYNCLGDPELCILTVMPKTMTADYMETIPAGTNYLDIHVDGEGGGPLEGAYVSLVKGTGENEEVFIGGFTDEAGDISLTFNTLTADTMYVTITCRNYVPYQGICMVNSQASMVGFNDVTIGGDGIANPRETVELDIQLKNFGASETATSIVGELSSNNPSVHVITGTINYPDMAPGDTCCGTENFVIGLDGDIPDGETIALPITVTSNEGTYQSCAYFDVSSMKFSHISQSFPDGGDQLDPGETANMIITIENIGQLDGVNLTGTLTSDDPYIGIDDGSADFGTINAGQSGSNSGDYFTVTAHSAAYDGRNVNFQLELADENGVIATMPFSFSLGDVDMYDAVGPDNYGYYMYENIDQGYGELTPEYDWVDIHTIGSRLSFYSTDDGSALVELPFDFIYYGRTYTHIIVCTNGFISPDTAQTWPGHYHHNWDNYPIPDPGNARGQISPFWDDLNTSSGGIYTYNDTTNHRFVIEWYNNRHTNTGSTETFEVILYDAEFYPTRTGDCEMLFQYYNIVNNDNNSSDPDEPEAYSSIGIENWAENDGIQYEWRNIYHPAAATIANGRAIRITTNGEELVGVEDHNANLPQVFSLKQNHPNPFNASTMIKYELPVQSRVVLDIYDILGRRVKTLEDGMQPAGSYQVIWNADDLPSGVYFYKLQAGEYTETRKMMLVK